MNSTNNNTHISDELKEEMLKHRKYVKETVIDTYNELSSKYE